MFRGEGGTLQAIGLNLQLQDEPVHIPFYIGQDQLVLYNDDCEPGNWILVLDEDDVYRFVLVDFIQPGDLVQFDIAEEGDHFRVNVLGGSYTLAASEDGELVFARPETGYELGTLQLWTPDQTDTEVYTFAGENVVACDEGIGSQGDADPLTLGIHQDGESLSLFRDQQILVAREELEGLYTLELRNIVQPGDRLVFQIDSKGRVTLDDLELVAFRQEDGSCQSLFFTDEPDDPQFIRGLLEVYQKHDDDGDDGKGFNHWVWGGPLLAALGVLVLAYAVYKLLQSDSNGNTYELSSLSPARSLSSSANCNEWRQQLSQHTSAKTRLEKAIASSKASGDYVPQAAIDMIPQLTSRIQKLNRNLKTC